MRLVFVYNADLGFFNALTDTIHKVFSPETYACSLCRFTYGTVGMVRPWKQFLEALGVELAFYHRNEFRQHYDAADVALPAVLVEDEGQLTMAVPAGEIDACASLEELMEKVGHAVAAHASGAV